LHKAKEEMAMAAPNPNHRLLQKVQILQKFRSLLQDGIDTTPILLTDSRRLADVDSENRIGQVQVTRMYNLGIEKNTYLTLCVGFKNVDLQIFRLKLYLHVFLFFTDFGISWNYPMYFLEN
jgi:hypothetical protein